MEVGHLIYSLTRLQIPKIGQQQGLAKKNQGPALKELRYNVSKTFGKTFGTPCIYHIIFKFSKDSMIKALVYSAS